MVFLRDVLLKFKKKIKGMYLYLLLSSFLGSLILLIFNFCYLCSDKGFIIEDLFLIWIAIILCVFIFIFSFFGYKNFIKNVSYNSFFELRYKFIINILMLGFVQFLFLNNYIIILVVLYLINLYFVYVLFFSKIIYEIEYYNDLEKNNKEKII